ASLLAFVLVVQRHQLDRLALDAALGVEHREVGQRPIADVLAELGIAARQRSRLPDHPFVLCRRGAGRCDERDRQRDVSWSHQGPPPYSFVTTRTGYARTYRAAQRFPPGPCRKSNVNL